MSLRSQSERMRQIRGELIFSLVTVKDRPGDKQGEKIKWK